ncbi:MAG: hypothetical protein R3D30_11395 [Hyphomicrobiales bacterium]
MWKIVVVLVLTALAILGARLAYEAPHIRLGATAIGSHAPVLTPPLMYAGVRG